ncbi:MAG: carboxymuconolactone decarboxylase family protein [Candidatus Heimdallarchaeota archaeon]|nr:carboxymuconolactone decarboxylase family protein [Candidatus Heimdallarchaeota archaeon]
MDEALIPERYKEVKKQYPELFAHYEQLGESTFKAGPLEAKSVNLVKLAFAAAVGMEGATHAHTRKCIANGFTPEELRHAIICGVTTLGMPTMMRALSWVDDEIKKIK